jgi:hypothetical protein
MRSILIALALLVTAATARAGGHIESKGYPPDGTIWTFEIYTDATDAWDSVKGENPPLSAKKAKELAAAARTDNSDMTMLLVLGSRFGDRWT